MVLENVSKKGRYFKSGIKRLCLHCDKREDELCGKYGAIPDLCANPACMSKIVGFFEETSIEEEIREISITSHSATRVYSYDHVKMIREISKAEMRARKEVDELERLKFNPKCRNINECSKNWAEFTKELKIRRLAGSDPIKAYILVLAQKRAWRGTKQFCLLCRKSWIDSLETISHLLAKTTLVSAFLKLKSNYDENDREVVYNYFLRPIIIPRTSQTYTPESNGDLYPVEEYTSGPYSVTIMLSSDNNESVYSVKPLTHKDTTLFGIQEEVTKEIRNVPQVSPKSARFLALDELLRVREQEASRILRQRYPELPKNTLSSLAELICYESIGFGSISALLTDENVDEFFIDQPSVPIYLDHRKWGRCKTNITPSLNELMKIETRLRAESGFRLDRLNPSIKTEISTRKFAVRASIDVSPLAADGFHLDVRRLGRNRFSLVGLVENGTLSSRAAAYFYFCLLRKVNIIVIGEPGSGKTTLINALDLLTPQSWRKITVEDTLESIPQKEFGKHQVRLKVEPFEEKTRLRSKSREIISLLHRTPDVIYLGEIQTASHSRAMFHALSAGLTGLQTCHAHSPEQALVRWVIHHKVPPICLQKAGIIIHMKKLGLTTGQDQKRRVIRVCEIREETGTGKLIDFSLNFVKLVDVFRWDPLSNTLHEESDLFETPALRSIREYEALTRPMFEEELNRYRSLFDQLVERKETGIRSTTNLFSNTPKNQIEARKKATSDNMETQNQWDKISILRNP
jgi:Flp pilus assembly CpaF family ATPase